MTNIGCRFLLAGLRRRRKKAILNLYWSKTDEKLKEIMVRAGNKRLKKYGGGIILSAIDHPMREKIIYDYIV